MLKFGLLVQSAAIALNSRKAARTIAVELLPSVIPYTSVEVPEHYDYVVPEKSYIQRGDVGEQVEELQRTIKSKGIDIEVDGKFGPATERHVIALQTRLGLVADGRVGEKTLLAFQGLVVPGTLSQQDMVDAAAILKVPVAAIMAVSEVESRGRGFFSNGLPAILYERHIMARRLRTRAVDPTPFIRQSPDIVNTSPGGYVGGVGEYNRLYTAKSIHREAAQESASWGAYQIMGFHWDHLGFASPNEFVEAMKEGERNHLMAFVRFIQADRRLLNAIRSTDWKTFASIYNGPNYHINNYDVKMAKAFVDFTRQGY
jgi:hypothetical protein